MNTPPIRILIADDTQAVHDAYRSIFFDTNDNDAYASSLAKFAPEMLPQPSRTRLTYEITHVMQGEDAIRAIAEAQTQGAPFALAILDIRMPPGIDGVQTGRRIRELDHAIQIVLCTAYADYTWSELADAFPEDDGVLLLKKPFDAIEVQQLAHSLFRKWLLAAENAAILRNLENRVAARTEQLTRTTAELQVALQAAKVADRAKHNFLRCVSHELNTPLNGVHGAASVLAQLEDPLVRDMGEVILESSARLNRLFSRILLYLQLESAKSETLKAVSKEELIARAVEIHRTAAQAKGLTLNTTYNIPALIAIRSNPDLLVTALDNLIENAIKFTSHGSVDVTFAHDAELRQLKIEVADTGQGIEQPKLDEISTLFSPGDETLTRRHEGLGIGLALIARIARHLGGHITAKAATPTGTIFTLTVPCH